MSARLNSDIFLEIFSQVEKWLREKACLERTDSFYKAVELAAARDGAVRRYKNDLKEFADLRNAITHERTDSHVIAEPNKRAIDDFQHIRDALLNPPKVVPMFQGEVVARMESESISTALLDMYKGSFSQLPILRGNEVVGLLTSETVARWLAYEVPNELVTLLDTPISKVQEHLEDHEHYCFLPRNATLYEALAKFEDFTARGKSLDAALITHSGVSSQGLIGILTVYDLPALLTRLGLRRISTT